ncbi:hypothetical protein PENSPDRAFT_477209 [Peniophora sp. CONT]|nr:hypothetical protein PENSPDRAFT_477209 [Peniophora sp. CONT]
MKISANAEPKDSKGDDPDGDDDKAVVSVENVWGPQPREDFLTPVLDFILENSVADMAVVHDDDYSVYQALQSGSRSPAEIVHASAKDGITLGRIKRHAETIAGETYYRPLFASSTAKRRIRIQSLDGSGKYTDDEVFSGPLHAPVPGMASMSLANRPVMPRASGVLGYTSMTDNRSLTGLGGATYNQGPLLRRFAMRGLEVSDESGVLEPNSLGTRDFANQSSDREEAYIRASSPDLEPPPLEYNAWSINPVLSTVTSASTDRSRRNSIESTVTNTSTGTGTSAFTRYGNLSRASVSTYATSRSAGSASSNRLPGTNFGPITYSKKGEGISSGAKRGAQQQNQISPYRYNVSPTQLVASIDGVPWELHELPRQLHPKPHGDIFGQPVIPRRVKTTRWKPKGEAPFGTDSASLARALANAGGSTARWREEGDEDERKVTVQREHANALTKALSALRR